MTSDNQNKARWFIRKQGEILGPYPNKLISRYLILERIHLGTEVSQDQQHWSPVSDYPALVPEVVRNAHTPEGAKALSLARIREDERSVAESNPELAGDERRANEDQITRLHRQLKDDVLNSYKNRMGLYQNAVTIIAVVTVVIILVTLFYRPERHYNGADCHLAPAPGINWSGCDKQGINLAARDLHSVIFNSTRMQQVVLDRSHLDGADLSYADLSQASLIQTSLKQARILGTVLRKASLQQADLSGADLSYADLTGASLDQAILSGAKFDQAIWVNGKTCLAGSVGECLQATE